MSQLILRHGNPPTPEQNLGFLPVTSGSSPVLMERYRAVSGDGFIFTTSQTSNDNSFRRTETQLQQLRRDGSTDNIDLTATGTMLRIRAPQSAGGGIIGTFFTVSGTDDAGGFLWVEATTSVNGTPTTITTANLQSAFPGATIGNSGQDAEYGAGSRPTVEVLVVIPASGSPQIYSGISGRTAVLLDSDGSIVNAGYVNPAGTHVTETTELTVGSFNGTNGLFLPQRLA